MTEPTRRTPSRRRILAGGGALAAIATLGGWVRDLTAADLSPAARGGTTIAPMQGTAPVLFIGHGSPMNAIRDNDYSRALVAWGLALGRPKAVLMVSAHWLSERDTQVSTTASPPLIYDFGGFPKALYEVRYPAPGAPAVARQAADRLTALSAPRVTGHDRQRGLDHGAWTVLRHLYPAADVPVFQLSIDITRPGEHHLALGRALAGLREAGVLIIGSGNVVHNLQRTDGRQADGPRASTDWAQRFDDAVLQAVQAGDTAALARWQGLSAGATMAVPFPDHDVPLLYAAGAAQRCEPVRQVFEGFQAGTISMRCMQWG
ncbi:MAG TPA: 4,5-DOPA dioxygenase extradiol [Aquabacterium sp.]|nr:4,5-DOPA dioxygenase extradiol [Aquabacterium sp.]HQC97961.1 4,5-DOPA dioxygenase extradiol [Aquabacterium sp.]